MKILVDLSYIHSRVKLRESVALYAFRFLKNLSPKQKGLFTLLIVPSMKAEILKRVGEFDLEYFNDIPKFLTKIPYLKGFLRAINWGAKIRRLPHKKYNCIYIPFCWSGNSNKIPLTKIVTIHDLRPMREATRALTGTWLFDKLRLKALYLKASRKYFEKHLCNANTIIAISNYVKDDLANEWPQYKSKIFTVYNSVDKLNVPPQKIDVLQNTKYILYVNTLSKYKNIITLISAFKQLISDSQFKDIKLTVVGKSTPYWENIVIPLINGENLSNGIIHLDYVTDQELIWLYQNATVFVTPSIHEGFGYTPIEAAIYGCPVISTRCDSLPDVTDEKVRYYDPPTSKENLLIQLKDVLLNPANNDDIKSLARYFQNKYSSISQQKQILTLLCDEKC